MRMPVDSYAPMRILGIAAGPPVPGYVLWVRSTDGLNQTAGGSPATADGDPVGQWQDQSGSVHDLLQATSGRRPILKLNQINGFPCVHFDGVDDYLNGAWAQAWPVSVFIVVRMIAWTSGSFLYGGGSGDAADLYMWPSSPAISYYTGTSGSGNPSVNTLAVGAWGILRTWTDAGQKSLRHNANAESIQSGVAGSQAGITLGAHPNPSNYGNVEFAEVILYPSALNTTDESSVRNYLNVKYAIF